MFKARRESGSPPPLSDSIDSEPSARRGRWHIAGPGMVAAATAVGSGDLIANAVAGARFGYALVWAVTLGCIIKIALAEGVGRWHLASGSTMFAGWRSIGRWTSWYFAVYMLIWGIIVGAGNMAATAMPLNMLFPALPIQAWGIICALGGLTFVVLNRYGIFEKVMSILIGFMFVTIVGLALTLTPNVPQILSGLVITVPDGSVVNALAIVGGVGGTLTIAAYGYWVTAKGWKDSSWMRVMRLDNRVAYATIGIFALAMLVIGAELLNAANLADSGSDEALLANLVDAIEGRYGAFVGLWFLVGFLITSLTSLLGVWNGVGLIFADFVKETFGDKYVQGPPEKSMPFRFYVAWLTFPPMILLFFTKPVALVIASGVLGGVFLPFLGVTLLILLNSKRIDKQWRSGYLSNGIIVACTCLFVYLYGIQVAGYLS